MTEPLFVADSMRRGEGVRFLFDGVRRVEQRGGLEVTKFYVVMVCVTKKPTASDGVLSKALANRQYCHGVRLVASSPSLA